MQEDEGEWRMKEDTRGWRRTLEYGRGCRRMQENAGGWRRT